MALKYRIFLFVTLIAQLSGCVIPMPMTTVTPVQEEGGPCPVQYTFDASYDEIWQATFLSLANKEVISEMNKETGLIQTVLKQIADKEILSLTQNLNSDKIQYSYAINVIKKSYKQTDVSVAVNLKTSILRQNIVSDQNHSITEKLLRRNFFTEICKQLNPDKAKECTLLFDKLCLKEEPESIVTFTSQDITMAQTKLRDSGYDPGPIDGILGPKTTESIKLFQQKNNLNVTGELDQKTVKALKATPKKIVSPTDESHKIQLPEEKSDNEDLITIEKTLEVPPSEKLDVPSEISEQSDQDTQKDSIEDNSLTLPPKEINEKNVNPPTELVTRKKSQNELPDASEPVIIEKPDKQASEQVGIEHKPPEDGDEPALVPPTPSQTPPGKGLVIMSEVQRRNDGFGDSTATMLMVFVDKGGTESSRKIRVKTLEVEGDGDKGLFIVDSPRETKGIAFLTFSHKTGNDDQWLYLPAQARIKRIAAQNKQDSFMGSEFAYEDISSQEIEKYTYKYIRDEVLDGKNCFVVESYPVDSSNSGYSKIILWVDNTEYRIFKADYYDRKNNLLKTLTLWGYNKYKSKYWRPLRMLMLNHQTGASTRLEMSEYKFKTGLNKKDFNLNSLNEKNNQD